MIEQKLVFNKKDNSRYIKLDAESPFLKITRIEYPAVPQGSANITSLVSKYKLKAVTTSTYGDTQSYNITIPHGATHQQFADVSFPLDQIIAWKTDHSSVNFLFSIDDQSEDEVHIYYTNLNQEVGFQNPFDDFYNHIKPSDNVKILFSAPFGQGKTTFLHHYFEQHKDQYEVFRLYPVNYAVAHNEDIFKYIKTELLFQLLGRKIEFEKEKFSYSQSALKFFKKNPHKVLAPFLRFLPGIGKDASEIYESFYRLAETFLDFHDELQKDEEKDAISFIKGVYDQEGSIYEDNYYTQIIRQLLELHKAQSKKQNVLIIDDLDRMDPDHIFRIFNVFAAHFDSPERYNGLTNKFGFDKIILVCDVENIQSIYSHRYGNNTSISGYLTKYYSRSVFEYDNLKAMRVITKEMVSISGRVIKSDLTYMFESLINDLIDSGQLTLRDLFKLRKNNFFETLNRLNSIFSNRMNSMLSHYPYFVIIAYLEEAFTNIETIKLKFINAKNNLKFNRKNNYTMLTAAALNSAAGLEKTQDGNYYIKLKQDNYTFIAQMKSDQYHFNYDYYYAQNLTSDIRGGNLNITGIDFFEILLLNIQKYKDLKEATD